MSNEEMKNVENVESTESTEPKPKKSKKKLFIILGAATVLLAVLAVVYFVVIQPSMKYTEANELLAGNMFDDAVLLFEELGEYKDSQDMITETEYQRAQYTLQNGKYDEAQALFVALGEYKDSKTMIDECTYQKAVNMIANHQFDEAQTIFDELGEYSNSAEMITECHYQRAVNFLDNEQYATAKIEFEKLEDYKDAKDMVLEVDYIQGTKSLEEKEYRDAIKFLKKIIDEDYKDTADLLDEAYYERADQMYYENKLIPAYNMFKLIPDYPNVDKKMESLTAFIYEQGVDAYMHDGDIDQAEKYFKAIPEYEDSTSYLIMIACEKCNDYMQVSRYSDDYTGEELFNQLRLLLDDFDNALEIMLGDTWIGYFLEGEWTDGKNTITIYESEESIKYREDEIDKYFAIEGNIIRGTYEISGIVENVVYYFEYDYETEEGEIFAIIAIEYDDYDTIKVYSFSKDTVYVLKRVKD